MAGRRRGCIGLPAGLRIGKPAGRPAEHAEAVAAVEPRALAEPRALTEPRAPRRLGGMRGAAREAARVAAGVLRLRCSLPACLSVVAGVAAKAGAAKGAGARGGAARRLSTTL